MKLVRIIEDCFIPSMPAFKCGQQGRVGDHIADLLKKRSHAKSEKGKSEKKVEEERNKTK